MKTKRIAILASGVAGLLLWAGTALALNLNYPYFPIERNSSCASTWNPSYCVYPANGTHYTATPNLLGNDWDTWVYTGYSSWNDDNKLTAMCVSYYESGHYVYRLNDNYPTYQSENSSARFDYGLMQINSQHGHDPYWLILDGPSNMLTAYNLWTSSGWSAWYVYPYCDTEAHAAWQYVYSSTCSYDPPSSTWGYWSNRWVWVWYLGYAGDDGNGIAGMFC